MPPFSSTTPRELEVYLWKESPVGYALHGILVSGAPHPTPLLSQDGESIVTFGSGDLIQLWRIDSSTILPSSILAQSPLSAKDFIVEFSPCGMFAAVAKQECSSTYHTGNPNAADHPDCHWRPA